jgi:hypothetical protein
LLIRVRGGSAGRLTGFGGRGAVMVENLSLVGEESFAAIGANGKRGWHEVGEGGPRRRSRHD